MLGFKCLCVFMTLQPCVYANSPFPVTTKRFLAVPHALQKNEFEQYGALIFHVLWLILCDACLLVLLLVLLLFYFIVLVRFPSFCVISYIYWVVSNKLVYCQSSLENMQMLTVTPILSRSYDCSWSHPILFLADIWILT